jgi:hypothetical protein
MLFQKVNTKIIINEIKKYKLPSFYFLDDVLIKYFQLYNPESSFEDVSFIIKDNKNLLFCPLTIEKKNSEKYLNYFGNPFSCLFIKKNDDIFSFFKENIKQIFKNENISNLNFLVEKSYFEILKQNIDMKNNFIRKISNVKYINLSLKNEETIKGFSKGLKHVLNKNYSNLSYRIIDKSNYNKEILEMKKMHHEISNKITRSDETWSENQRMLLEDKAFLVQVRDKNYVISYSLFFNNYRESGYFSSCTYREFFNQYKNINHNSIFEAIKYLKKKNCKRLTLGETKIIFSEEVISDKEKSIATFKSSFGGEEYIHYYLDKNSLDFIDLYLK